MLTPIHVISNGEAFTKTRNRTEWNGTEQNENGTLRNRALTEQGTKMERCGTDLRNGNHHHRTEHITAERCVRAKHSNVAKA